MKFLKNRASAILVSVAIMAVAASIGVHANLARLSRDIEQMFYDGVFLKAEGYLQPSVNSQIEKQIEAALGLATVMNRYPELAAGAETLMSVQRELLDAKDITGKGRLSIDMQTAFYALLQAARSAELSERDLDAAIYYYKTFSGAQTFVAMDAGVEYNAKVSEFQNGIEFPASLLNMLAPAGPPGNFTCEYPAQTYPDPSFVFP